MLRELVILGYIFGVSKLHCCLNCCALSFSTIASRITFSFTYRLRICRALPGTFSNPVDKVLSAQVQRLVFWSHTASAQNIFCSMYRQRLLCIQCICCQKTVELPLAWYTCQLVDVRTLLSRSPQLRFSSRSAGRSRDCNTDVKYLQDTDIGPIALCTHGGRRNNYIYSVLLTSHNKLTLIPNL